MQKVQEELDELRKRTAMDEGDLNAGDDDLKQAVARARENLKQAKSLPEGVRGWIQGGYEARIERLEAELEAAYAAKTAASPLK